MRLTFRSLCLLLVLCCLTGLTLACGQAPADDAANATESSDKDGQETAAPSEPPQFQDGFESGDTSGWSDSGDADETDAKTSDDGTPSDG